MKWIECKVTTTSPGSEIVSNALIECGSYGAAIYDRADLDSLQRPEGHWDMIDEALYDKMGEDAIVSGFFRDDETLAEVMLLVTGRLRDLTALDTGINLGPLTMTTKNVDDEDWVHSWKKHYKPMRVGERFIVCPVWETYAAEPSDRVIFMDPGTAFGTGAHETTSMCLQLLEKLVQPGDKVIDVGCGTAILSVGAVLAGAQSAIAVDIDPLAVSCAHTNVKSNGLEKKIKVKQGDLLTGTREPCDLLLSNIVADVIIRLCDDAKQRLRPGGYWICSGIITERRQDVLDAVSGAGFIPAGELEMGSWLALAFINGSADA